MDKAEAQKLVDTLTVTNVEHITRFTIFNADGTLALEEDIRTESQPMNIPVVGTKLVMESKSGAEGKGTVQLVEQYNFPSVAGYIIFTAITVKP